MSKKDDKPALFGKPSLFGKPGPGKSGRIPGPLSAFGLPVIVLVVLIDQIAKQFVELQIDFQDFIPVLPILALYRAHNTGIAFSLGNTFGALVLIIGTLVVTALVLGIWRNAREGGRLAALGFALIIGGAIGNLIDRVLHGYVIDFLYLHVGQQGFFVFNLADVALTFGPIILAFVYIFRRNRL